MPPRNMDDRMPVVLTWEQVGSLQDLVGMVAVTGSVGGGVWSVAYRAADGAVSKGEGATFREATSEALLRLARAILGEDDFQSLLVHLLVTARHEDQRMARHAGGAAHEAACATCNGTEKG